MLLTKLIKLNTLRSLFSPIIATLLALFFIVPVICLSAEFEESEIKLLFNSGEFLEAGEAYLAVKNKTDEDGDKTYASKLLTEAAWSFYLHGKHHADDPKQYYKIALMHANEAIKYDANASDAYVQKAIALTFSNQESISERLETGLEIKAAFEKAIELDGNVDGYLGLAAWHATFVSYVSNRWFLHWVVIGRDEVKKSRNKANTYYDKVFEMARNPAYVHLEYARGLLVLNAYKLNNEFIGCSPNALSALKNAESHLQIFMQHQSQNELDRLRLVSANKLLEKLKKDYNSCI